MGDECWLPELFACDDLSQWEQYENEVYPIFERDFVTSAPTFNGKQVRIRRHPIEDGREGTFWHVTCCDYGKDGNRSPDPRRCERIEWIRSFIENYNCKESCCAECDGLYVWSTQYRRTNSPRFKILFEEERYVVIIEERSDYCLLITAYYLDADHSLRKLLKEYDRACKQEAPQ